MLNEDSSVAEMSLNRDPEHHFALPISIQAYEEFDRMLQALDTIDTGSNLNDSHVFAWGNDSYSSAKYYKFIFSQSPKNGTLQLIWKSKCLPKLKVFVWLLLLDRLNTKDLMHRKNWHIEEGINCVLCDQDCLETRDHLFFDCAFASLCWEDVGFAWDFQLAIFSRVEAAKQNHEGPCFLEIFACVAWNIWKTRNDLIFRDIQPAMGRWRMKFQDDLLLHQFRVKDSLVMPLLEWIRNSLQ